MLPCAPAFHLVTRAWYLRHSVASFPAGLEILIFFWPSLCVFLSFSLSNSPYLCPLSLISWSLSLSLSVSFCISFCLCFSVSLCLCLSSFILHKWPEWTQRQKIVFSIDLGLGVRKSPRLAPCLHVSVCNAPWILLLFQREKAPFSFGSWKYDFHNNILKVFTINTCF